MFTLEETVAIVSGARGRLGPIWIRALLDAGAVVAALDLPGSPPSQDYIDLQSSPYGMRLREFDVDVTDRRALENARDEIGQSLGEPDVLVNNAGVDQPPDATGSRHEVQDLPVDQFRRMVEVNLLGTFQATQVFGQPMTGRRRGSIINIGSLYASVSPDQRFYDHMPGRLPFLKSPAYGASKAGVVNLSRFFATLWGASGVRVNTLSPGGVLGGQDAEFRRKYCERVPLGRMAGASDLKGPLLFLASDASAYVTGIELRVDGGFTAW